MRTWLVTGSSRGIGKAIAQYAAQKGEKVYAAARQPETLKKEAQNLPTLIPIRMDVTQATERQNALQQIAQADGLDVLVNNAGYGLAGAWETLSEEAIRRQMETNFFGAALLMQQALPLLRKKGKGFIFNITSVAGYFGFKGMGAYNASKFALVGLSEAVAQEVRHLGIWVCSVAPGPYRTDWAGPSLEYSPALLNPSPQDPYAELHKTMAERFPQTHGNQPGDPYHIARLLYNCVEAGWAPIHLVTGNEAQQIWEKYTPLRTDPQNFRFIPHSEDKI
ncbi:MAG: SDR family oxidoreductase [Bacteroidia bacterium]